MRLWIVSFFLAVFAAVFFVFVSDKDTAPPRVIWITIDSLRADHMHYMGYGPETTPYLDDLAKKSVNFRMALSPSSMTFPSVPAYMTGRYPSEFLSRYAPGEALRDRFETLPEAFQRIGYETWWFTTNPNTASWRGFDQGVDHFHYLHPASGANSTIEDLTNFARDQFQPADKRQFIYFHIMDVHLPYLSPYPHDRQAGAH